MELEQKQAEILRSLYRMGLISYKELDYLIDILTVKLLYRTGS